MESEGRKILTEIRNSFKKQLKNETITSMRTTMATVISVEGNTAVVRLPYAKSDGSEDFSVNIITRQEIVPNDVVTLAYWSNLSTAILLCK